jgi:hypothetical protein
VKRYVEMGHTDMREWSAGPWVKATEALDRIAQLEAALSLAMMQIGTGSKLYQQCASLLAGQGLPMSDAGEQR